MKKLFLVAGAALFCQTAIGQTWNAVGSHGTRTNLLVGLGIDPPTPPTSQYVPWVEAKQYVNGNIAILQNNRLLFKKDLSWYSDESSIGQDYLTNDLVLKSNKKIILDAELSGGAKVLGALEVTGDVVCSQYSKLTGLTQLGIGTTTPQATLHVAGDMIVDGDFMFGSTTSSRDFFFGSKVSMGISLSNLPGNYRLYVKDGILTESVKVALSNTSDWADYVFEEDYKLMPLSEVRSYIQTNKHLPNVPSSEEMVESGLDLAKMDAKLLEKVEELTLYLLELKEENDALKERVEALEKEAKP
jgi:hypothetical protein